MAKLMYCPVCKIDTVHRYVKALDVWVCWCGCEVKA